MINHPQAEVLIEARDLKARFAAGEKFVLLDARDISAWRSATLPGARAFNVYDYFIPDSTARDIAAMAAAFVAAWQSLDVGDATPVWFEEETGMRSPRGAWFHWLTGEPRALILNGGVSAWRNAGGELMPGNGTRAVLAPLSTAAVEVPFHRELVATRDEVIAADGGQTVILDARRPAEHSGEYVHDCCARAGRIPGSRRLFWEEVIERGKFRSPTAIAAHARRAGFSPEQRIISYCHRGARAATLLAALRLAGFQRLAIYVGSWHEWAEKQAR